MRFKIHWARLVVGRNLPFLPCFPSHLRANSKYKPPGGRIFGRAYTWTGLFSEFYGNNNNDNKTVKTIMTYKIKVIFP